MRVRVAVFALLAFRAGAFAADTPKEPPAAVAVLAIEEGRAPSLELAACASEVRQAMTTAGVNVLAPDAMRARMEAGPARPSLDALDASYAEGVAAANGGDALRAIQVLSGLVATLESLPASNDTFGRWVRTHLRLARAQTAAGKRDQAAETLQRMLRADRAASADPDVYPPSFVRQVDAARAAMEQLPQRRLTATGPQGTRVFVEGREVGLAPVTVLVAPGKYRVAGVQAGPMATVEADVTRGDQTVTLTFTPDPIYRPQDGPGLVLTGPPGVQVTAAALKLNVAEMVTLAVRTKPNGTYLVGTLQDVRRGTVVREAKLPLTGRRPPEGALEGLAQYLAKGVESPLIQEGCDPSDHPRWATATADTKKTLIQACGRKPNTPHPACGVMPACAQAMTALGGP